MLVWDMLLTFTLLKVGWVKNPCCGLLPDEGALFFVAVSEFLNVERVCSTGTAAALSLTTRGVQRHSWWVVCLI